jgi:hypothetical protein
MMVTAVHLAAPRYSAEDEPDGPPGVTPVSFWVEYRDPSDIDQDAWEAEFLRLEQLLIRELADLHRPHFPTFDR